MTVRNTEEWQYFFQQYRELPELWQTDSDRYKNKNTRDRAWGSLLDTYMDIVPDSTLSDLKRKIFNVRSCYRRELKKVLKYEALAKEPDDLYVPQLWYFEWLDFLRDHTVEKSTDYEEVENPLMLITKAKIASPQPQPTPKRQRTQSSNELDLTDTTVEYEVLHQHAPEERLDYSCRTSDDEERDEAAIYAEGWACSFRKLNKEQRLYAKKLIDDALLYGQLHKLHITSAVVPAPYDYVTSYD